MEQARAPPVSESPNGHCVTRSRFGHRGKTSPGPVSCRWQERFSSSRRHAGAGLGDYAILASVQSFMPELGIPPENIVFVTGSAARALRYYMDTYGMHGIHGRAPALATGVATSRPDLSVWVVSGDGDALSIGGNHLIHALRRNVPLKILLFNNQIYGLTKGQYSPTSEEGKVTKSTPFGSQDHPFNPVTLALGAEATFVARTVDTDKKHRQTCWAAGAPGSLREIYQNCNVFNAAPSMAVLAKGKKSSPNPPRARPGPFAWPPDARAWRGTGRGRLVVDDAQVPRSLVVLAHLAASPAWRASAHTWPARPPAPRPRRLRAVKRPVSARAGPGPSTGTPLDRDEARGELLHSASRTVTQGQSRSGPASSAAARTRPNRRGGSRGRVVSFA